MKSRYGNWVLLQTIYLNFLNIKLQREKNLFYTDLYARLKALKPMIQINIKICASEQLRFQPIYS